MYGFRIEKILGVVGLIAIAIFVSCSSGGGDGPTPPPPFDEAETMTEAWADFDAGLYEDAEVKFGEVIEHNEENEDAYLGRGWSRAFQSEFSGAVTDFLSANDNGHADFHADMGLAAAYRDLPNFEAAINYSKTVLNNRPQYVFSKVPTVNYMDAHLIIAQSHFRLGGSHYADAHEKINYLCRIEGLDTIPEYGTLPAEMYEKLLAERLSDLTELIGD